MFTCTDRKNKPLLEIEAGTYLSQVKSNQKKVMDYMRSHPKFDTIDKGISTYNHKNFVTQITAVAENKYVDELKQEFGVV